jgi:hypothetical protein
MKQLEIAMCEVRRGRRGRETQVHMFRVPVVAGAKCLCGERRASAELAATPVKRKVKR